MNRKTDRTSPIAVFDSGLGGISILRVLRNLMPNENYIYYGDSANAPYGEKTHDEVRAAAERVTKLLLREGAKAVVIACNTATSAAAEYLRSINPNLPIIGMEPAVKPAACCSDHPTVLVMATPLTLKEEKFRLLTKKYRDCASFIDVPCHGLVEMVESGVTSGNEMNSLLHGILDPYTIGQKIDAAVLGCTHYIHARAAIENVLAENLCSPESGTCDSHGNKHVQIFDGALGTAKETERRLSEADMLNTSDTRGSVKIYNSSEDTALLERSYKLLNI